MGFERRHFPVRHMDFQVWYGFIHGLLFPVFALHLVRSMLHLIVRGRFPREPILTTDIFGIATRDLITIRPVHRPSDTPGRTERRSRLRRGRISEALAAALLLAKGYRILGRRVKTRAGEIDLIAARGGRIAFIEVKRRLTIEDAEAAITRKQAERIRRAANLWLARHPRYQEHEMRFDVVFLVPGRWPRHIVGGLSCFKRTGG